MNLFFLIASIGMFAICIYFSVIHNMRKGKRIPGTIRMLISTAFVILALGFLHFASLFGSIESVGERVFVSFINTLQSFSMDLNYGEFLFNVKDLGRELFPENSILALLTLGYAYTLGVIAPVFGGAILLEVITTIFPSLKLSMATLLFWKDFCYFSELNDRSLAMAKSLSEEDTNPITRRIIVFTDVYSDSDEESENERLFEAKRMSAIILKRDIRHVRIRKKLTSKHGSNHFFLIDDVEINNLQSLSTLAEENPVGLKESFVYLFMQSDVHELVENEILDTLEEKYKKDSRCVSGKVTPGELLPVIKPIKTYKHIANNLFFELPLYEPLVGREKGEDGKHKLNVTVVGTGSIGTEVFLSAYWYGQIYGTDLYINFVTNEEEKAFKKRIGYINTDIFETGVKYGEEATSELLRIYPDTNETADPYFTYRYYECDLKKDDLHSTLKQKNKDDDFCLLQSDYVIIAIGSDEENIEIASQMKRYFALDHLESKKKKTVIAFSVYDSDLCETVRRKEYKKEKDGMDSGVYMYPFASLSELYSYENVFMKKSENDAKATGKKYDAISGVNEAVEKANEKNTLEKIRGRRGGDYNYWADHARARHIKYKAFAAEYITKSVFSKSDDESFAKDWERYKAAVERYENADEMQKHLAWMEHRRWNAFLRTMGYKKPSDEVLENYFAITKNHKNLTLKLHPFLVESDKEAMDRNYATSTHRDMLEEANVRVCKLKNSTTDYKVYDYPYCDFE